MIEGLAGLALGCLGATSPEPDVRELRPGFGEPPFEIADGILQPFLGRHGIGGVGRGSRHRPFSILDCLPVCGGSLFLVLSRPGFASGNRCPGRLPPGRLPGPTERRGSACRS
jgi:hypothetical protein